MTIFIASCLTILIATGSITNPFSQEKDLDVTEVSNEMEVVEETPEDGIKTHNDIRYRITSPEVDEEVSSPLTVEGEISGTWFFEATFPVELTDKEGNSLATGIAQTTDEWMTEELVSFTAELTFDVDDFTQGILILKKSNPSDLPENDDEISFPVFFSPPPSSQSAPEEEITIEIYFASSSEDPDSMYCDTTYPVDRIITKTSAVGKAAINELLAGPTEEEADNGYYTAINDGTELVSLSVSDGTAYADFNNTLQEGVGGSCLTSQIRSQIESTLMQFSTVNNVVITIGGNSEGILQP